LYPGGRGITEGGGDEAGTEVTAGAVAEGSVATGVSTPSAHAERRTVQNNTAKQALERVAPLQRLK